MLHSATVVGLVGVTLLLAGFFLNLIKWLDQDSMMYLGMNLLGAGLACAASWMIGFLPFVVLEATWCLVALVACARRLAFVRRH
ncbi:MAG: CBU_0592 family membrane protein [Candidatus Binatia bacterium]